MSECKIEEVLIVGSGWIGRQIAAQLVAFNVRVWLYDTQPSSVESAIAWIDNHLRRQVELNTWNENQMHEWRDRISLCSRLGDSPCHLLIECTPEKASSKRRVLRELSETYAFPCIIASNSSYFIPSHFASHLQSPERFLHWHFHAPVWLTRLVDVVPCSSTLESIVEAVAKLSARIDQTPIIQRKENSGYIFNSLLRGVLESAMQLWNDGVATPEQIDFVWRSITRMERGPFRFMDEIGLDVVQQAFQNAKWDGHRHEYDAWIERLNELVQDGRLGVKSTQGFFRYEETD